MCRGRGLCKGGTCHCDEGYSGELGLQGGPIISGARTPEKMNTPDSLYNKHLYITRG